ncbi:alpha-1,2-mannosyltransferase [Mucor ambiguus]|uniref:Alpha-1,2-mannosyltransferase n=1 Tax=Mucor ambiguus TaxID=91626 RepID=A0A0C9LU45_9FUNG|nr:alpha-1,2-mannosyltransferase [Mucor ambiguus]
MVLLAIKKQKLPVFLTGCLILLLVVTITILSSNKVPVKNTHQSNTEDTVLSLHRHAHKVKGCYVILIRNSELDGIASTMAQVEDTFNSKFDYPYVFLNDEPFTDHFKSTVASLTKARVLFGLLDSAMWGYPDFIDQEYAAKCRESMTELGIPYASSESYRHMCRFVLRHNMQGASDTASCDFRFQSGFFFRHPLLDEFDYYWRLEPYVDYYCQIDYDVFKFMKDNKKKYGFTIAYKEHIETVPTLWKTVMSFLEKYPDISKQLPSRNESLIDFVTDDGGQSYNTCHFWSNFEVGDLSLWRSEAYLKLFDYLDRSGGFFYERYALNTHLLHAAKSNERHRWGDAPVHSIAAAILLKKSEFHFFNDIGYRHTSYTHCPVGDVFRTKCSCDPNNNFDFNMELSCYPKYKAAMHPSYKRLFDKMLPVADHQDLATSSTANVY